MSTAEFRVVDPYREMQEALSVSHIGRQADGGLDALRSRIRAEGDGRVRAIRAPWRETDKALGFGLTPGEVTIVTGSAGAAKSYLVLNVLLAAGRAGFRWRLLPTEDDAGRWIQRALAVHCCRWGLVSQPESDSASERQRVAEEKLSALDANREFVEGLYDSILENPRLPLDDGSGSKRVPDLRYQDLLEFLSMAAADSDLIAVDCLSQIDFSEDGRDWRGQSDFMRRVVGIAASTGAHVILVGHNGKGGGDRDPLDRVQGSALFNRLAHNILALSRSDPAQESEIYNRFNPMLEHRLTLSVLKCRGGASGDRVAMDLHEQGPTFVEHGRIKARAKGWR